MSTVIPPEFSGFVTQEIASGRFRSEEEVVREGLRLLQHRQKRLGDMRQDLQKRLASLDSGQGIDIESDEELGVFLDEVEEEVRQELAAQERAE